MRALIVSDIHSNLPAFQAVLQQAAPFDIIWCLGDVVGYGPQPNECIELLREYPHVAVAGNHDWAALGRLDLAEFNAEARWAARWTTDALTPDNRSYLEALPTRLVQEPFTIVHGSPREPIWEYILYSFVAAANFEHFDTPYCLIGHTHSPALFVERTEGEARIIEADLPPFEEPVPLGKGRCIINPGSVGQPRDGDPRASYAIWDTDKGELVIHRVSYDIETIQALMAELGFPARLIARLSYGW
ncbi:MAG: metallophosphoesterase family protein [Anaerolineae bacterium]